MLFVFFILFLTAYLFSTASCFVVRRIAPCWGLIDKPGGRKIHADPMPTGGGLGIGFGVIVPLMIGQLFLFFIPQFEFLESFFPESAAVHFDGIRFRSFQLWKLLSLGSVLLVLGTLDDRFNLNWKLRLAVQVVVSVIAVRWGWRFSLFIDFPLLTDILSVIWIVGLINSFNMLDNMNGLSAGIAAICAVFFAMVMFLSPNAASHEPQFFIAGFLLVLVGSLAGFLMYNNPFRASIFMGDGGAYFIGFLLATSTLTAVFSNETSVQTVYVPLLILAVPLYDTTTVLLLRIYNRKSLFVGDKNHFSHRLVELGFSKTQAVLTVYLTTIICCLGSLLLYKVDFFGASLIFIQTFFVLLLIGIIEFSARRKK